MEWDSATTLLRRDAENWIRTYTALLSTCRRPRDEARTCAFGNTFCVRAYQNVKRRTLLKTTNNQPLRGMDGILFHIQQLISGPVYHSANASAINEYWMSCVVDHRIKKVRTQFAVYSGSRFRIVSARFGRIGLVDLASKEEHQRPENAMQRTVEDLKEVCRSMEA
ncbi:hypothetical protein LTR56_023192 [Elasticomyces elasticus]|nr:hypothetical protein LTR56_023192 [Elasticomyces elasticus]KAK3622847.1 hypothetical protein LTR22_024635 [Elasticomyces elasticus]KAK4895066.1 hypothetical protein LTR49_028319 [Elasticomyces elasticus]KAK5732008.1 hypothetical protein LTS12_027181 [Elasticomyces elasticus]